MEPEIITPKKSPVLAIIGTSLVTALIVGGGVYAFENNQNNKTQKDLQAQIDTLKGQVVVATATPLVATSATPAPLTIIESTPTPTPVSTDIPAAQKVATTFMNYMVDAGATTTTEAGLLKDRSSVLELFTPAVTAAEKSDFDFIAGIDLDQSNKTVKYPGARILSGTAGFAFTIAKFSLGTGNEVKNVVTFPVTATKKSWNGDTYINSTNTYYIDLVQVNSTWMVSNYYNKTFKAAATSPGQALKYSALNY